MVNQKDLNVKEYIKTKLILGFTGSISSGCTHISELLKNNKTFDGYKFHHYKLSTVIKEHIGNDNYSKMSIFEKQQNGNELRKKNGGAYLVFKILEDIDEDTWKNEKSIIIIDGIKNHQEVKFLREWFYNFFLFSICADKEVRKNRSIKIGIVQSAEEFDVVDHNDEHEELLYGQQVGWCNYLSDIVIRNDEDYATANDGFKGVIKSKIYKYLTLIINNYEDIVNHDLKPTIDELAMTLAYTVSTMSSCIKRKVGSVIIQTEKSKTNSNDSIDVMDRKGKIVAFPNVVSSGYNEGPIGSTSCILDVNFQMCYRDFLFQTVGKKFLFCPNCGERITIKYNCPKCNNVVSSFAKYCTSCGAEINMGYKCKNEKCKKEVFSEFVPGGNKTLGKSLDICRALHAEEQAIIRMSKNISSKNSKLSLYVTTQPCKLCSNKIASSKIEEVIYVEPYEMKDALQVLEDNDIIHKHFEGIKGPSFYKLFSPPIGFTNILKTEGD